MAGIGSAKTTKGEPMSDAGHANGPLTRVAVTSRKVALCNDHCSQ